MNRQQVPTHTYEQLNICFIKKKYINLNFFEYTINYDYYKICIQIQKKKNIIKKKLGYVA